MPPKFTDLIKNPLLLLALGFGSGLAPKAPGTFGTLAAIPLYFLFYDYSFFVQLLIVVLTFLVGVYLCQVAADIMGVHDHPSIVWDEFVGFWLTMLGLSFFNVPVEWYWLALGFLLFRFFDIVKPWPIRWVDRKVSGGFGIMFDDLLAGIYAGALLILIVRFLP